MMSAKVVKNDTNDLEEGELSEDSNEAKEEVKILAGFQNVDYIQVERPLKKYEDSEKPVEYTDEEDNGSDESSNSDEEPCKKLRKQSQSENDRSCHNDAFASAANNFIKQSKNRTIWCGDSLIQDEISANLLGCGVRDENTDRFVENYPYPKSKNQDEKKGYKRKFPARNKGVYLRNIEGSETWTDEKLGRIVAKNLREHKVDLIVKCVEELGKEKILELYSWTKDMEEVGGVKVVAGTRRRSPGGTFFYLLKNDDQIPKKIKNKLCFSRNSQRQKEKKKLKNIKRRELKKLKKAALKELPTRIELVEKELEMKEKCKEAGELNGNSTTEENKDQQQIDSTKSESKPAVLEDETHKLDPHDSSDSELVMEYDAVYDDL